MAEFKLCISEKGKSFQKEIKEDLASVFMGKRIGETINGDAIGLAGLN
ncbi:MAG: S6e family ribosomal protein [Nanoarchaeota archaeon]